MKARAVITAAVLLAAGAAPAAALDQFGQRGRIDLPRQGADAVQSVAGLAAARDGGAVYVLDSGPANSATDECGAPYTPLRVHRFTLDGRQVMRTIATTSAPGVYVSAAVAADGVRDVLAIATATSVDIDGDGACARPASPGALTVLDAATLAPVRTVTRAQFGGREVLSVGAQPLAPGAAGPPAVYALARTARGTAPALMRFSGVPDGGPPVWSKNPFALAGAATFCPFMSTFPLAAEPGGSALIDFSCGVSGDSRGGIVRIDGAGATATLVMGRTAFQTTGGIAVAGDGTIVTTQQLPSLDADGAENGQRDGVAHLRPDGSLLRAWGDRELESRPAAYHDCRFGMGQYRAGRPFVAVAGDVTFAATAEEVYAGSGPNEGARLMWFGAGAITPRCLVRPRPVAALVATPPEAGVGEPVRFDASASAAARTGAGDDNVLTAIEWRPATAGFEPPAAPTDTERTLRFDAPGTYTVDVRVTDAYGEQTVRRMDYFVRADPPRARLAASTTTPRVNEPLTLDASRSTGPPVHYELDLDGDGRFERDNGTLPTLEHRFLEPGAVDVGLRVANNKGEQAATTLRIDVQPPGDPAFPSPPPDGLLPAALSPARAGAAVHPQPLRVQLRPQHALTGADARVRVLCPVDAADCRGRLRLQDRRGALSAGRAFIAATGRSTMVVLRLSARGRRAIARSGRLRATVSADLSASDGRRARRTTTLTLRRG